MHKLFVIIIFFLNQALILARNYHVVNILYIRQNLELNATGLNFGFAFSLHALAIICSGLSGWTVDEYWFQSMKFFFNALLELFLWYEGSWQLLQTEASFLEASTRLVWKKLPEKCHVRSFIGKLI